MPNRTTLRECPEPIDDRAPLFAHQITLDQCAGRQEAKYHKCFSCAHFRGEARPAPAPLSPLARPGDAARADAATLQPVRPAPAAVPAALRVG